MLNSTKHLYKLTFVKYNCEFCKYPVFFNCNKVHIKLPHDAEYEIILKIFILYGYYFAYLKKNINCARCLE